jgi:pyruvate/2-oxoglutarate dehydrogenase complex dihydrolipoamide acyltransferase (E2) component
MRGAAAVVVVGAVLAVVGADTGAQTRASGAARAARKPKPAAPRVLVRLADEVVTEADVRKRLEEIPEQFRAQYGTPEGKRLLLERMVEEKVWLKGASKAGVAERPEVQAQLERQRRDLLVRTYVNEVMAANSAPSDSEMMAFYEEHETEYRLPATVTVSHLQTRTESEAKRIKGWLDRGQSWDAMVKRYSADTTTRKSSGRLGAVTREGLFPVIGTQQALA